MKLTTLLRKYDNETFCEKEFKKLRDKAGIVCPKCGGTAHYYIGGKAKRYKCKECGAEQGLRANTTLHRTKLPYRYWFVAVALITSIKNTLSTAEIQRQLGHKHYRPIFNMMHKIRTQMGVMEDGRILTGHVEVDEAYFNTYRHKDGTSVRDVTNAPKKKRYQRVKPVTETNTYVVVMAESFPVKYPKNGMKQRAARYIQMKVVPDIKADTLFTHIAPHINPSAHIIADGTHQHKYLKKVYAKYTGGKIPVSDLGKILPYTHIAIGNAKAQIRNIHHTSLNLYLQLYLNEFVYKWNNRKADVTSLLLQDIARYKTTLPNNSTLKVA